MARQIHHKNSWKNNKKASSSAQKNNYIQIIWIYEFSVRRTSKKMYVLSLSRGISLNKKYWFIYSHFLGFTKFLAGLLGGIDHTRSSKSATVNSKKWELKQYLWRQNEY
jgi:hypothetical protein